MCDVSFSGEYRDAVGNVHARFCVATEDGKQYRGESVYDSNYERTILDEDVVCLPKDLVVAVKRAMKEFATNFEDNEQ